MSNFFRRISIKKTKRRLPPPGTSPGSLQPAEGALPPKIDVYSFSPSFFEKVEVSSFEEIKTILHNHPSEIHWIDVKGLGDSSLLETIRDEFSVSTLILEDILHTHQRPKLEEFEDHLFATSRMLCLNSKLQLENEQISFLLTERVLLTFQENYEDCLDPVRKRLLEGKGNIRIGGTSYLMYALMDLILDNYFILINRFGDELDSLEELLYRRPGKSITYDAQQIKRALITVRRAVWPERDKINDMLRSSSPLITDHTKTFLRDVYDHSMQIIDLVESYKEIATSVIDMYLSFMSNRTNEIMRVLTVISSIFIPLTFIAGVYGMNFADKNPETGQVLEKNMPELYSENGYLYTMFVMGFIALVQVIYFWRKGWLK
ncbi:magnesium/cobalt transporter CorA [Desertivirga xinjiangensis]|uniref:magnesium/cobalt transporter CorA n=1 Tax=Desertivirga xinjiangensis TaxID=539206 RepID=UPI00210AF72C|nr:magnesium/cobalt transporter CorA [Pedobacter xinjiangensis]